MWSGGWWVRAASLALCLLQCFTGCQGLRIVQLRVPAHKFRGKTARLNCIFDLEGQTLYSVQWYKDGAEFYRYLPADSPPAQVFPLPGVSVDMKETNETRLVLLLLNFESSGMYRCEVSTEAPDFHTVHAQARLVVMVLPGEAPRISGVTEIYREGEPVEANCTSARSKPAANLTWYINDYEASQLESGESGPVQTSYKVHEYVDRLEQRTLGLRLAAHPRFFPKSPLREHHLVLRCTATLGALEWHVKRSASLITTASAPFLQSQDLWLLILLSTLLFLSTH